ncbi:MAG: sn-glycerol-3-phosphate ABC transporter ATP-binding protein UgpC [Candidatus Dormibacteraeota bacterium]|uniref:Sn-glycerol-3-phosphate ABC transporter ATP-binding protein UgpC n=1 Tax=Candidatus Dormiibacter inghamiae TaxID=3127013 RepID=A0A934N789_9BACT|nr:sn-glycerol-3-phosphate ABC transporter ATP-binding protein UgpC [Candidatus Dormibacteraeota bacterium]MBJ7606567.1 sn-glycerol-3-phosphate ABC transporter ATP-binding protein UgpC [Candidatus Dormibacteraeota bacterium]
MASVTYDHVVKRYTADVTVVKDFNVEIQDKEFMVLVGPSGCGKSTALRMLAGLEGITEGEIRIGERKINDVAAKDRDIAMVFQSYALYPHMSVYDNMAFPLQMRHMPKAEIDTRVKNASRILGLDDFLQRKPRALSGGQRQRVALGRAIVRDPQVFLLDEPLSNLDAKLRGQTRIELQKLHRDLETTFIYVTHDQVEAMTMGDRIALMYDGVLQQVGTPSEIYDHPANLFVAGFIGSPSMNFVPVTTSNGTAKGSTFEVKLPKPIGEKKGTLGFRPEALTDRAVEGGSTLEMKVDVVERLGSDQYLYGQVGGDQVTARVDPRMKVASGDEVRLGLDIRSIHVFDAETDKALL